MTSTVWHADLLEGMLIQESAFYSIDSFGRNGPMNSPYYMGNLHCHGVTEKTDADRHSSPSSSSSTAINEEWRRKVCQWCFEVVDYFGFDREVVSIALNFLDRAVASSLLDASEVTSRTKLHLVAITSLYLAIKLHGQCDAESAGERKKLRIDAFVLLSKHQFQVSDIEAMERRVLNTLEWRVNPPTSFRFASSMLHLIPIWSSVSMSQSESMSAYEALYTSILEMARYLTELAVCASELSCQFKPSVIAFAAILCAVDALVRSSAVFTLPSQEVQEIFRENIAQIMSLRAEMSSVRQARILLMEMLDPGLFPQSTATNAVIGTATFMALPSNIHSYQHTREVVMADDDEAMLMNLNHDAQIDDDRCPYRKPSPICVGGFEDAWGQNSVDISMGKKRSRSNEISD